MKKLFDLELSKKSYANLAYILITAGVKFNNKEQLKIIMYKFYNYIKDYIDTENPIVINTDLKEFIQQFVIDYNLLENPHLETGYYPMDSNLEELIVYTETNSIKAVELTEDDLINEGMLINADDTDITMQILEGNTFSTKTTTSYLEDKFVAYSGIGTFKKTNFLLGVNISKATTVTLQYGVQSERKTDGYQQNLSGTQKVTIPANTKYIQVEFRFSTLGLYIDYIFLNEQHEQLSTVKGSSYFASKYYYDYNFRMLYLTSTDLDLIPYRYIEYNYEIDEDSFMSIELNNLIDEDIYSAEDVAENDIVAVANIIGKDINGVKLDKEFEYPLDVLTTQLGAITKVRDRFMLITKTDSDYYAFMSSYPLYYTGTVSKANDADALMGLYNDCITSYVIYHSVDGYNWEKSRPYIPQNKYTTGSYAPTSNHMTYIDSAKIIYSNYPIFYRSEKHSSATATASNFSKTYCPKLFKNADTPLTLGLIPPVASIEFGKHKVEGEAAETAYQIIEYSDYYNLKGETLPENSVYLQSTYVLDYLVHNTEVNKTDERLHGQNSHLHRWLNSSGTYGQWHNPLGDFDVTTTPENISSSYQTSNYAHRAGFLHSFSNAQKNIMLEMNLDGRVGKVTLINHAETPSQSLDTVQKPRIYAADGYYHQKYYSNLCSTHNHPSIQEFGKDGVLNKYASTKLNSNYWRRNGSSTTENSYYYNSGNTKVYEGTMGGYIHPVICLPDNLEIGEYDEENNVFKVVIPPAPEEDFEGEFETELTIVEDFEDEFETERINVFNNESLPFETKRIIGVSVNGLYETIRHIQKNVSRNFATNRQISEVIEKSYPTERIYNFYKTFSFGTKRKVTLNKEYTYGTERNVTFEMKISKTFNTQRIKTKNIVEIFEGLQRIVLGSLIRNYQTKRAITKQEEIIRETVRTISNKMDLNFNTKRDIVKDIEIIATTRRKNAMNFSDIFDTNRAIYVKHILAFETARYIQTEVENMFETDRSIFHEYSVNFDTLRYITEPTVVSYPTRRNILEKVSLKFATIRSITKTQQLNTLFETKRVIVCDKEFRANTKRYIYKEVEEYLTKAGLQTLTVELKSLIGELIDAVIEYEIMKRNK